MSKLTVAKELGLDLLRDVRARPGGGTATRRARVGGAAAMAAAGAGLFFLTNFGKEGSAWASQPQAVAAQGAAALRLPAAGLVQAKADASSLVAARPFLFSALDQVSKERAQQCLAEAIYYEAGSESPDGQRAVAQVVLNRVRHGAFPNSICGVVYQGATRQTGCQFTFTCDGSLSRQPSRGGWARAMAVAREALDGAVYSPVGHATHYHASWMTPYWAPSVALVGQIGGHIFYSMKGSVGSAAAFSQAYAGLESSTTRLAEAEAEQVPALEAGLGLGLPEPGLALSGRSEEEALADPDNADLLNFRSAGKDRPATQDDEIKVASSVRSALQ